MSFLVTVLGAALISWVFVTWFMKAEKRSEMVAYTIVWLQASALWGIAVEMAFSVW